MVYKAIKHHSMLMQKLQALFACKLYEHASLASHKNHIALQISFRGLLHSLTSLAGAPRRSAHRQVLVFYLAASSVLMWTMDNPWAQSLMFL